MTYFELAKAIDVVSREVSSWEKNFLESILRKGPGGWLSEPQQWKLRELGEAYVSHATMAEFNGQLSLL